MNRYLAPDNIDGQVAAWWDEAEVAVQASQTARARRFLRWILAARPEDEEAWLRLAELASNQAERIAYLKQAYFCHPASDRMLAALREARAQQLESRALDLVPRPAGLLCLPDQRLDHASNGKANGHQ